MVLLPPSSSIKRQVAAARSTAPHASATRWLEEVGPVEELLAILEERPQALTTTSTRQSASTHSVTENGAASGVGNAPRWQANSMAKKAFTASTG